MKTRHARTHLPALALGALSVLASAPAFALCSTNSTHPHLCVGGQSWGGSQFAAGYSLRAGLHTRADVERAAGNDPILQMLLGAYPRDYVWLGGEFDSHVVVFGQRAGLVAAELSGKHWDRKASTRVLLRAAGITVVDRTDTAIVFEPAYTRDIVRVRKSFHPAGVPVTVEAAAVGTLGVLMRLGGGWGSVQVRGEPYLIGHVEASASVGAACAQAGIRGSLTALRLGVPATAGFTLGGNQLAWDLSSEYSLSSLDGAIELFGEFCGVGDSIEIFSWNGRTWATATLYTRSGTRTL